MTVDFFKVWYAECDKCQYRPVSEDGQGIGRLEEAHIYKWLKTSDWEIIMDHDKRHLTLLCPACKLPEVV